VRRGLLVVLSGPSGVGKDSVLRRVFALDPRLVYSVSYTTRPPRPGEVEGVDYSFVSEAEMDRLIAAGEMLEWAHVHGHRSGTGRSRIEAALAAGRDIVLNVDVQGGAAIRERVEGAFLIFLVPPSVEELDRRRRGRGTESAADLAVRAADAAGEMALASSYDAVVVNDDLDRAAAEVLRLIDARRAELAASEAPEAG
jgi:guanylate kinase